MSDLNTEKNKRPAPVLELLATLYTLEQLETATHDMPQLALAGRSNVASRRSSTPLPAAGSWPRSVPSRARHVP